ncbi:MAG: PQQ-binding-like beta-propeller repeat protein, partial [Gammaproteobacteria bacterium]
MAKWYLLSALFYVLSACSLLPGGGDDTDNIAELTRIQDPLRLKARWKADTGGAGKHLLNLVPAYDNGRVYASDYKGRVQAFDADSGKRIWKANVDVLVSSGPGVGEGLVLLGTSNGEVVALSAKDGSKSWNVAVTG